MKLETGRLMEDLIRGPSALARAQALWWVWGGIGVCGELSQYVRAGQCVRLAWLWVGSGAGHVFLSRADVNGEPQLTCTHSTNSANVPRGQACLCAFIQACLEKHAQGAIWEVGTM